MLGTVLRITLLLFGGFFVVVVLVWAFQERLVFLPPRIPAQHGNGAERIDFSSTDGQPLFGFFIKGDGAPSSSGAQRVMVHFHGNGDLAHFWIHWAHQVAHQTGWSVFLAEYRGYGGLPGRPTYEGVMRDARATMALVEERYRLTPHEIVLYGHSLGTGVVAQLAAERGARAVLLEAPITSIVDAGRRSFMAPFSFFVPWISRIHFAPVDQVSKTQSPVWIVCGDCDEVAPASMSEEVFAAAARRGELLLVTGARHNDIADSGGEKYWQWMSRALRD